MALSERLAALLGVSAWAARRPTASGIALDPQTEAKMRALLGGGLAPPSVTRTRWYLQDVESAEYAADIGDFSIAAQLMRAARRDGFYSGALQTRTGGVVRLPRRFKGREDIIAALESKPDQARSVFDEMLPASELALLVADGFELGFGVAEFVEVPGRDHKILIRLNPEFVRYSVPENRWYYSSAFGMIEIVPGDGRWVLHVQGGRLNPWQHGAWRAIARSMIRKDHAKSYRDNWIAKLANSARAAVSPAGSGDGQKQEFFEQVIGWGVNTVFGLTPGFDVKLIESNGRGHEGMRAAVADENEEIVIIVSGQSVTTDGGSGFVNGDLFKSIRGDLIEDSADGIADTINTQCLPQYIAEMYGEDALIDCVTVEYDAKPPKDKNSEATSLSAIAGAIKSMTEALSSHGIFIDAKSIATNFGIPTLEKQASTPTVALEEALSLASQSGLRLTKESVEEICARLGVTLEDVPAGKSQPRKIELAPTDLAKVVRAIEARASAGLPPFNDERDQMTISELAEKAKSDAEGEADIKVNEAEQDNEQESGGAINDRETNP